MVDKLSATSSCAIARTLPGCGAPEQEALALLLPSDGLVYANRKQGIDNGQCRQDPADRLECAADWTNE